MIPNIIYLFFYTFTDPSILRNLAAIWQMLFNEQINIQLSIKPDMCDCGMLQSQWVQYLLSAAKVKRTL